MLRLNRAIRKRKAHSKGQMNNRSEASWVRSVPRFVMMVVLTASATATACSPAKPMADTPSVAVAQPAGWGLFTVPANPPSQSTHSDVWGHTATPPRIRRLFEVSCNHLGMQSLAYDDGFFFVGYATQTDRSIIQKYDIKGHLIHQTKELPIRHCASLSILPNTHHLLVTNGGSRNPTQLYEVDFVTGRVVKTIQLMQLGNSGLAAVDKSTRNLWVATAHNDSGPQTFSSVDEAGHILRQFHLANQGVPQGLDVARGHIFLYTNNKITTVSLRGKVLGALHIDLPAETESEGLVCLPDGRMVFGYQHRHQGKTINTLYQLPSL